MEGEGEPNSTRALVTLLVSPIKEGELPLEELVNNSGVQQGLTRGVFGGKVDAAKTKTDTNREVGNYHGASLQMSGGEGKVAHWLLLIIVHLKQTHYEFQVNLRGGRDVTRDWGAALTALFAGVNFPDLTEPVSGPLGIEAVPPSNAARGTSADKELDLSAPGVQAKKPKGMVSVSFQGSQAPALRFAMETRAADGQTYFYFDTSTYSLAEMQKDKKDIEDFVKERETQWKTGAGDSAVTVSKGKDPWFEASMSGAKGVGYRFTGAQKAHPFVELGWVVRQKATVVWFRAQFGGEGAEKTMDAFFKAVRKSIKFPI